MDAAVSGLSGLEAEALDRLLQDRGSAPPAGDPVTMLAGAISRSRDETAVTRLIEIAADASRPMPSRLAVLAGVEAGLQGGGGGRGGGRAGGRGRAGGAGFGLSREPAALIGLMAAGAGDLSAAARRVAALANWPAKPVAPVDAPRLTPSEQKRFDLGQEIYKNICSACHQPDGLGKEKIAPSLINSRLVTGNAAIGMRILISGKEGATGLMPPLAALTDEQVAAVLTYIRREWGHTASAVTPEDVLETRQLTSSRKRPWTDDELARLLGGRGGGL